MKAWFLPERREVFVGRRVIFYSESGENVGSLEEVAKRLDFRLVLSSESEGVWDMHSAVCDLITARHSPNYLFLDSFRACLDRLGVVTFSDLSSVPAAKAWEEIVRNDTGVLFICMLEGMREVGVCFSDWDLRLEGPVYELRKAGPDTVLFRQALSHLNKDCIRDLALLRRVIAAGALGKVRGLGPRSVPHVLEALEVLSK